MTTPDIDVEALLFRAFVGMMREAIHKLRSDTNCFTTEQFVPVYKKVIDESMPDLLTDNIPFTVVEARTCLNKCGLVKEVEPDVWTEHC